MEGNQNNKTRVYKEQIVVSIAQINHLVIECVQRMSTDSNFLSEMSTFLKVSETKIKTPV